jgi:[ribosomal protein S18]-alanine N-acetyltransferase
MSEFDFAINRFRLSNLGEVLALEKKAFPEDAFGRMEFLILFYRARSMFLLAQSAGKTIGYIVGYVDRKDGYIASIAVDAPFRKKGTAQALFAAIRPTFIQHGANTMTLHVRASNAPAIALYRKLGFNVAEALKDFYPDGEGALFMHCPLV